MGATVALVVTGLGACHPAPRPAALAAPPPSDAAAAREPDLDADVLAVFEGPSPPAYQVAIERCSDGAQFRGEPRCPITIRLVEGGRVVDRVALPDLACGKAERVALDDLFATDPNARAWMTGAAGCRVGVAARDVQLTPEAMALLVTQRSGWEHVGHRHLVYLAQHGKLSNIWNDDEETTTALDISVLPSSSSHQDLAVLHVDRPEGSDLVRSVRAKRLHWDPPTARMLASPLPDAQSPLFLLYLGPFPSAEAARRVRMRPSPCTIPYPLLPASLFPGLKLRGFLLGSVVVSQETAETMKAEIARCPQAKPAIIEYVPKVEYMRKESPDAHSHG
jgi:hypothetical protein